jgi:membrane associated rhomboid family serine protease
MGRIREYFGQLPLCTLTLLVVNVLIHITVFLTDFQIGPFTFIPYFILYDWQWYRAFTSAFLHGGLMHIGMNMMSLVALGGALEPAYGTLRFLYITWMAVVLEGILYVAATWLSATASGDSSYLFSNSIGFSGVLFSYAVIEAFHSPHTSRSVFGCFNVPTKAYPFVLLIILQVRRCCLTHSL